MDLEKLLQRLIDEEGLTEEEALSVAAARVRAHRKAIQKVDPNGSLASVQEDGRGVDYGDETPAQAKARWLEQERNDPQGVYSPGGATPGGIFGMGAIPMDDYDAPAVGRTMGAVGQAQQLKLQAQLLQELQEMRAERQQLAGERERKQLDDGRGNNRRRLGKKRRE